MRIWAAALTLAIAGSTSLVACTSMDVPSHPPAPNLLSPAPAPTSGGECVFGTIRADIVRGRGALEAIWPYVPTWLPPGFGLSVAWRPPRDAGVVGGPTAGAIWTDEGCRQISLEIFPGAAAEESPRAEGVWKLIGRGECTFGDLRDVACFTLHAQAGADVLNLTTADLPEEIARRIVDGIELPT